MAKTDLPPFRSRIERLPRWLKASISGRILYAIFLHLDVLIDLCRDALRKRFPLIENYDVLPLIGADRKIIRGPFETDETYVSRLPTWLDVHKTRGGPYALLEELYKYYAPNNFKIELVYASTGLRFTLGVDGSITVDTTTWRESDGNLARWARWRLFYYWPTAVNDDGTWADVGTWSDGGVWDSGLTADEVASLRAVPQAFNAAHCFGVITLLGEGLGVLWDYPIGIWDEGMLWDEGVSSGVATVSIP